MAKTPITSMKMVPWIKEIAKEKSAKLGINLTKYIQYLILLDNAEKGGTSDKEFIEKCVYIMDETRYLFDRPEYIETHKIRRKVNHLLQEKFIKKI